MQDPLLNHASVEWTGLFKVRYMLTVATDLVDVRYQCVVLITDIIALKVGLWSGGLIGNGQCFVPVTNVYLVTGFICRYQ